MSKLVTSVSINLKERKENNCKLLILLVSKLVRYFYIVVSNHQQFMIILLVGFMSWKGVGELDDVGRPVFENRYQVRYIITPNKIPEACDATSSVAAIPWHYGLVPIIFFPRSPSVSTANKELLVVTKLFIKFEVNYVYMY